jgi:ABC-type nitrate/sulfonate/bicarbonate transport system permease component
MIVGELAHQSAHTVGRRSSALAVLRRPFVLRLASVVVVLAGWQAFGTDYSTSFPSKIVVAAGDTFTSEVVPAFGDTLKGLGLGYGICVLAGIPIGLLMARVRLVELALEPYVNALYATPRLALIPVLILWLGVTFTMRISVVVVSGIFPIILNTYLGAREVDQNLVDAGRAFAANSWQIMRTVIFPGSLSYTFAGMRIGLGRAFIGVIVAEIETSTLGIGHLISSDATEIRMAEMWVGIICLGIVSIVLSTAIRGAERWSTMPWLRGRRQAWLLRALR